MELHSAWVTPGICRSATPGAVMVQRPFGKAAALSFFFLAIADDFFAPLPLPEELALLIDLPPLEIRPMQSSHIGTCARLNCNDFIPTPTPNRCGCSGRATHSFEQPATVVRLSCTLGIPEIQKSQFPSKSCVLQIDLTFVSQICHGSRLQADGGLTALLATQCLIGHSRFRGQMARDYNR
jgi:hypothetical protein